MAINVLFDSSFLFHRNLFSLANASPGRFFDGAGDAPLFVKKLMDDINAILAIFPKGMVGRLVWAKDSRSWRKDLIERISYKGTRVKDETRVNWDEFNRVYGEFSDVLAECGFTVSSGPRAEADDLLYLWSQEFLEKGESSVIVTSDRDLNQCVRHANGEIVCIFNPTFKSKKFTFHHSIEGNNSRGMTSSIDDLFSLGEETTAEKLLKISSQYEQEFVNPLQVSIVKVFEGDKGDNVPSAIQWKKVDAEGNERTYSFTQRMVEKLMAGMEYDEALMHGLRFDPLLRRKLAASAVGISKQDIDVEEVCNRILDNIAIMYLDRSVIPEEITVSKDDAPLKKIDLNEAKVYEIKPEWEYTSRSSGGTDSDIFSMMS